MTLAPVEHLSEETLHDVLIGLSTAEADAHLGVCEACRAELQQFRSQMELFEETSLAWFKSKPEIQLNVEPPWRVRQAILAPVGWAMAAAVLLIIGVPSWIYDHSARSTRSAQLAAASENGDSEAQIAQDNDLLYSVDVALRPNEGSSLQAYGLSDGSSPYRRLMAHSVNR